MDFFSLNNYDNNIIIIFTVRNFNIPFSVTNAIINQSAVIIVRNTICDKKINKDIESLNNIINKVGLIAYIEL